jgi:pimeloyl-ACP methyl ester carboxylesterase/DNA-binding winged helix-turn-helix (wHTH) protein
MKVDAVLAFGDYRLDPVSGQLLHGTTPVPLAPKAFALLHYLLAHAGRLVPKQDLMQAIWPDVFVGDAVLKVTIREVRKALGDDPQAPRYIETAHRRGYRFVAPVVLADSPMPAGVMLPGGPSAGGGDTPRVRYARSGSVNIAYQVVGSGPVDLVFVMGWVSHLEYFWNEPSFARFLGRLASVSRLILFDKRGTGLSDPVPVDQLPALDQRLDDVRAVMEAADSRRAVLLGVSEGGPLCSLFAATYPDKTDALIMIGSYARRMQAPDYPWGRTPEERDRFCATLVEQWGGPVGLEDRAPSRLDDPVFRDWWASYLRMGASPGAAVALTRMNAEIDIRAVLPSIRVPTLVLHRTGDRCLRIEEGRYLASQIPGAQIVELPGDDHLPFVGDQDALLAEIERFLAETRERAQGVQVLSTVLALKAAPGPDDTAHLREVFAREVAWHRGRPVVAESDRLVALFDGPARAVRCGAAVTRVAARSRIPVQAGVHIGECEAATGAPIAGAAEWVAAQAAAGEVLVSRVVVDLVPGSGLVFGNPDGRRLDHAGRRIELLALAVSP